ncbi:MAG: ubiquinone/menaquinone biosynthesis C-methylase UbiE, partial [Verrucomicrobiales bacterium]
VKPGINKNFLDPGLQLRDWIGRFEVESREVYHAREDIIKALELKPGMAVADIGAGTGLYMKPFAKAVGDNGKVYAVDISAAFVKGLKDRAKKAKFPQVEVVLCKEDSVELKPESIDLAFVCDTYHHFEFPTSTLASIHRALKPGGRLVIIDFERIEGTSSEWTMGHVRAGKEVFSAEIKAAKFEQVEEVKLDKLKDNYFLIFKKA